MNETDKEFRICVFHHEHKARMERSEKDIQDIWKAIGTMRGWVIAGSGSTILMLLGVIVQVVFFYVNKG